MKKIFSYIKSFIKSNIRQLLECVLLLIVLIVPLFFDPKAVFKDYLANNYTSPDNFFPYMAISHGKYFASASLFLIVLLVLRKANADFVMNNMMLYHNYCYLWYWFCAKVLGIKKCSLVLVPIYMQFKLIIRGTFKEYPIDETEYSVLDKEPECVISVENPESKLDEINIVIVDTYMIEISQLPFKLRSKYSLFIIRNNGEDNNRYYSPQLIKSTINVIRKLPRIKKINVFATTNPRNTYYIAKEAFALDCRGNVSSLYVYQQSKDMNRLFELKGYKIY